MIVMSLKIWWNVLSKKKNRWDVTIRRISLFTHDVTTKHALGDLQIVQY